MFNDTHLNTSKHSSHLPKSSQAAQLGTIKVWMATTLVVLAILALGSILILVDFQKVQVNRQQQLLSALDRVKTRTELLVHANMLPLEVMKSSIEDNPAMDQKQFERLVKRFDRHQLHIQRFIMAPDMVVQNVFPPFSDEPLSGLELVEEPGLWSGASQAIKKKKTIVSGPFDMQSRGHGLVIWTPVLFGEELNRVWGVVGAVIDHKLLLQDAGIDALITTNQIFLKDHQNLQNLNINEPQPVVASQQKSIARIRLPFGDWQLIAGSSNSPWYLDSRYQDYGLLILGLLFLAGMAGLVAWTYLRALRQRMRDHKKLELQRRYDSITNLPKRSLFLTRLGKMIAQADEKEIQPFALLYIDLDYFKQVNDMLGYPGGDQFLRKLSNRMQNALQPDDILARSGSDEFVMTVQNIHRRDQIETFANDLLKELGKPMRISGHTIASSCSIGIALYPRDGDDAITLLRHADRAMYQAKVIGRGTFCLVDKVLRTQSSQELKLRMELEQALQKDQFLVCYQPIIDMASGKVTKCEALVTWRDNAHATLLGNDYIAVAEQGGLIRHLGLWVLENVCKDMQQMQKEGIDLQISVNRSSQEFLMPDASSRWLSILDKYDIPRKKIVFEITESLLMDEKEKTLQQINLLKDSGIDFSIDDFGTGYSAINYLRRFPLKYLKIDQSFVRQMHKSKQDRVLVDIIIKLGEALKMKVIAEGVETENQYIGLRKMGCHFIQGYYVSKPLRLNDLIDFKKEEANKRRWLKYASQR
jgi:diguanylate cyclase (GGDEF)-like protein